MLTRLRELGWVRAIGILIVGALAAGAGSAWLLSKTIDEGPVPVNVRWKADVDAARRAALEQELRLVEGHPTEGTTWAYLLTDASTESIRGLVQHPSVDDTAHLNRVRFRPEFAYDRERRIVFYSVVLGVAGGLAAVGYVLFKRPQQ